MSAFKVTLKIDSPQKILKNRGLQDGGPAQKYFMNQIRDHASPYTPKNTGHLINMCRIVPSQKQIVYNVFYAIYVWNKYFKFQGAPMRGRQWIFRMWANDRSRITQNVAKFIGGKTG